MTTGQTPAQLATQAAQRRRAAAAARRRAIARRRAAERARRERLHRQVLAAAADVGDEISGALPGVTASARQAATTAAATAGAQAEVVGEDRSLLWLVALILNTVLLLGVFGILGRRHRTNRERARRVGPRRIPARVGGGPSADAGSGRLPTATYPAGDQVAVMRNAIGRRRARAAVAIACSRIVRQRRPERRSPPGRLRARAAELGLMPGEPAGARGGLAASPALPLPEADWPRTRDAGPDGAGQAGAWVRAHDLCIVGALSLVLGIVHAWGMGRYPAFFDDEGTYVSQAWSVDAFQELSPYTYWYDHPPLGWILLAGWTRVVPTFGADLYSVAAARTFMALIFVLSACLLYVVARRLGVRRPFAALAVLLFGLSPLAVHYQRMVLLDNIAVCWLLAAFALALSPRRRLWAYAGSGVCLAAASLTKETFVLFVPGAGPGRVAALRRADPPLRARRVRRAPRPRARLLPAVRAASRGARVRRRPHEPRWTGSASSSRGRGAAASSTPEAAAAS